MANVDSYIDWTDRELVEKIPGKVSGCPIVRGTRILADTIVQDAELGSSLEEIHENYPDVPRILSCEVVRVVAASVGRGRTLTRISAAPVIMRSANKAIGTSLYSRISCAAFAEAIATYPKIPIAT